MQNLVVDRRPLRLWTDPAPAWYIGAPVRPIP